METKMIKLVSVMLFLLVWNQEVVFSQDSKKDTIDVFKLSLEELLNIPVTTASKSEEKLSDAAGIISVLTRDDIERFGGRTLKDILNRVPGLISSTAFFPDRSLISSRGDQIRGNSGHILLLINGRPVREVIDGGINSEMFENFPVEVIERIEVIKGPGSVLYGSDAFSGVINIITIEANKNEVSLTGLAGNKGAYGSSVVGKMKKDELSIIVSGRYLNKARWSQDIKATNLITNQIITEKIDQPDRGKGFYIGVNYKNLSITSAYADWQSWYRVNNPFFNGIYLNQLNKSFTNVGYDLKLKDNWKIDFNITYTYAGLAIDSFPKLKRVSNDLVAEITNHFTLSSKSKLIVGGLFEYKKGTEQFSGFGETVTDVEGELKGGGLYTQLDYSLLNNFKLIGGVQVVKNENIKTKLVSRGGIIWNPAKRFSIKALYSQAFRSPSISELYLKNPTVWGNPNIQPETVGTIDLSVGYQGENMQVSLNYFNSTFTNIVYRPELGMIYNTGKITFQGGEFEGKYYVNEHLYLVASMLYQTHKDTGNMALPISSFGAKAGLSYSWNKSVNLSIFDIYQGEFDSKFVSTLNPSPSSYHLVNLYGKFNLTKLFHINLGKELSLTAEIQNLLDKIYYLPEWGTGNQNTVPSTVGRTVLAGLNITF